MRRARTRKGRLRLVGGAFATLAIVAGLAVGPFAGAAFASTTPAGSPIYSSIPSPLPANLPSWGFQAYQTSEFGDQVVFAGAARDLTGVKVTLSSWACESGNWYGTGTDACTTTPGATFTNVPITLNIYAVGSDGTTPGTLLASDTVTPNIPYRPSSSVDPVVCYVHSNPYADNTISTGGTPDPTAWYDPTTNTCNHGIDDNITFDFSSQNVTLPDKVIYGITYNTSTHGPNPLGTSTTCFSTTPGCPYDSLNISLAPQAYVGSQAVPGDVYMNSTNASWYCNPLLGTGVFGMDQPTGTCSWAGYVPAAEFYAINPPTSVGDCKKGGWPEYTDRSGRSFKNQGDCVSYVATDGLNTAAG